MNGTTNFLGKTLGSKISEKAFARDKPKSKNWREEAELEFFGINKPKPRVEATDLQRGSYYVMKKITQINNYEERVEAYEKYTGKKVDYKKLK